MNGSGNGQGGGASAPAPTQQLDTIQALRFIAAFAVVIVHSTFYTKERLADISLYDRGTNGVRLFFVISGFVMIASTLGLVDRPKAGVVFAVKRLIRIVPVYWVATLFKLAIMLIIPGAALHAALDTDYIVKSFFFIPALNSDLKLYPVLGVGWTLNFEIFFYLLFTVTLLLRLDPIRFIAPILLVDAAAWYFVSPEWPIPAQFWANPIVLDFLAGMVIARLWSRGRLLPSAVAWGAVGFGCL